MEYSASKEKNDTPENSATTEGFGKMDEIFETMEQFVKDQEKELKKIRRENERLSAEIDNIKANYIASIIVVLTYIFLKLINGFTAFGHYVSPAEGTVVVGLIVVVFFLRENIRYSKYIVRKLLTKRT